MATGIPALLEKAHSIARIAAKRRWLALAVACIAAIASSVPISAVRDRYQATARVFVDTRTVLKPLMAGLTFQPDMDEQVRMLASTLISRPNVERLLQIPDLQLAVDTGGARDEAIARLMQQIKVTPTTLSNLFEISYRGDTVENAQRVVQVTLDLFVRSGGGAKKKDSEDAGRFIAEQLREYEGKLVEAENRLKDFKVRTFAVSGISSQDYFARIATLTDEVDKLKLDLAAAERSRDSYRGELSAEEAQLGAGMEKGGIAVDLAARRKTLEDLRLRYTEQHPDIISARRVIAQMEAEVEEKKARAMAGPSGPSKGGEPQSREELGLLSPVYQRLRMSLSDAEARVASLRSQLASQESRLEQVKALAGHAPEVEAELAQLNRDYEIIRKNYELMASRRESASLGLKVDESAQLAEFRVIDPPRASTTPAFPARAHLALIALAGSIALGLGATLLAEAVAPTVDDVAGLRLLSGRPALGTVPLLISPKDQSHARTATATYTAAWTALIAVQLLWIAWLVLKVRL